VVVYAAIKRTALTADSHLMCASQPQLMVVLAGTLSATVMAGAVTSPMDGVLVREAQWLTIAPIAANISTT
jgi:hypothetical protein